jgi:hypothetical protein
MLKQSLLGVIAGLSFAVAISSSASAANLSRAYQSSSALPKGYLVSLVAGKKGYIEPANTNNSSRLLGIVVSSSDSLLEVGGTNGSEQVAITGSANALASSLNGYISPGDKISVSPFNGIGVKAVPGSEIIGTALTGLNGSSSGAARENVTDLSGKSSTLIVGYVKVSIAIGASALTSNSQENGLQRSFASLTGHVISTPRIIAALVVALATLVMLIVLMYASIYGSIISIGRNPLAKNAVLRSLTSVLGMAVMIFLIGALVVAFLLR